MDGSHHLIESEHGSAGAASQRRVAFWSLVLILGIVAGTAVLVFAMTHLREAHLYRQSSGEGLKFVWVGFGLLVANALLGAATFASVRLSSAPSRVTARRALLALAALIVVTVVGADMVAVWVESHGDRCIGPCG